MKGDIVRSAVKAVAPVQFTGQQDMQGQTEHGHSDGDGDDEWVDVPTLEDASTVLRVLARSATGQEITVYFKTKPADPDAEQMSALQTETETVVTPRQFTVVARPFPALE